MYKNVSHRAGRAAAVAFGASVLMAAGVSTASATQVQSGGVNLASGTAISAPLSGTAVLTATGGSASCSTGSIGGVVGSSTGSPTNVPVTSQTLTLGPAAGATHCVNSGLPFLVRNASLTSVSTSNIMKDGVPADGALTVTGVKVTANITSGGLPGTCVFDAASASGVITNATNRVQFTNVAVTTTSGLCSAASPATFTAGFAPVKTSGGGLVQVAP